MSFNIRYDNKGDEENWWEYRKEELVEMVRHYHPDFLGVQEGLIHQLRFIDDMFTKYSYIGVGRDDGKEKGEFAAIFYDSTQFELVESNTFWLSETSKTVSVGWDASMERICTYGSFINRRTKKKIFVFNAHFDHIGRESRRKSAQLIIDKISELNIFQENIIVMGDFNCEPMDDPILLFTKSLEDGLISSVMEDHGPEGTYNGFDLGSRTENRIDYIFTRNIEVSKYIHVNDRRENNLFISDHLPVYIEFKN
ncbi:MAG: endonuclease/exonuclease/phosphatase family protein [Bacteroidota bacterium]